MNLQSRWELRGKSGALWMGVIDVDDPTRKEVLAEGFIYPQHVFSPRETLWRVAVHNSARWDVQAMDYQREGIKHRNYAVGLLKKVLIKKAEEMLVQEVEERLAGRHF